MSNSSSPMLLGVVLPVLIAKIIDELKTLPPDFTIKVGKQTYSPPALIAKLESYKAQFDDANAAHTEWMDALKSRRLATPEMKRTMKDVVKGLHYHFDSDPAKLEKFGIPMPKDPKVRTAREKAASSERGRQTKELREQGRNARAPEVKVSFTSGDEPAPSGQPNPAKSAS